MFCSQCQLFWQTSISISQILPPLTSCEDVQWARHETILHRSVSELKRASSHGCPICRAILHSPASYERSTLLANEDNPLNIVLEIDPNRGPHPVISISFRASNGDAKMRIPKRMIAACAGLLNDGERKCCT